MITYALKGHNIKNTTKIVIIYKIPVYLSRERLTINLKRLTEL